MAVSASAGSPHHGRRATQAKGAIATFMTPGAFRPPSPAAVAS